MLVNSPKRQILDSSKLKDFADDNFKFNKNGRRLSKSLENNVENRRNCLLRAISPFPTVFSKRPVVKSPLKRGLVWERVKSIFPFSDVIQSPLFQGRSKFSEL